eukprot:GABV01006330.1.p1 GENE.GABV01006330.1~~GABV01006330.1.p1  ORF type:complete len:117 (-),score=39.12 GABV01006330.1:11-361(-)
MIAASFHPAIAFVFGFRAIVDAESGGGTQGGLSWSSNLTGSPKTRVSFSTSLVMLLVDTFLLFFIAWWLDHVNPGEFGVPKHPLFFLSPSYWRRAHTNRRPSSSASRSRRRRRNRH